MASIRAFPPFPSKSNGNANRSPAATSRALGLGETSTVEAGENSVGGGVGGDLEELVEAVASLFWKVMVLFGPVAVFDPTPQA